MSYDIRIAVTNKLDENKCGKFLSQNGMRMLSGAIQDNHFWFGTEKGGKDKPAFSCDVSEIAEIEDIDEELAASALLPKWLYHLSAPESAGKAGAAQALKFALFIAESCQGAAYDPQKEKIIYPKGKQKRYEAAQSEELIHVINMEWFLPLSKVNKKTTEMFLEILRKICPEALPQRYGDYEPLKHRFEMGEEAFISFAEKQKAEGNMLYFKTKSPCFGGSMSFPYTVNPPMEHTKHCAKISLSFDRRAEEQDARWSEVFVTLFQKISKKLETFYGMAYIDENVLLKKGGHLWHGPRHMDYGIVQCGGWAGIPDLPVWLSWYGGPYRQAAAQALTAFEYFTYEEGVLLQLGKSSLSKEEIKTHYPILPHFSKNLLSHREMIRRVISHNADGSEVIFWNHEDTYAEYIPELEG